MDKNTRPILIILAVLLVVSILFAYSLYRSKDMQAKEFAANEESWKKEKVALTSKVEDLTKEKQYLQDRLSKIQKELDEFSKKQDDSKARVASIQKERDQMVQELEKLKKENQELAKKAKSMEETTSLGQFLKEKADLQKRTEELQFSLDEAKVNSNKILQEKSSVELELNQLKTTKDDLTRQLKESQDFALRLSKQLTNEKGDNAIFSEEINRLTAERDKMAEQLQTVNDDKVTLGKEILQLNDKINKLEQDKIILNRRLSEVNQAFQEKLTEIMQLKSYLEDTKQQSELAGFVKTDVVELPPIVVRSEEKQVKGGGLELESSLVGHIVLVNEQQKFVILDLGEVNGVKKDMFFGVYRDGKEVAKLQVIEARDKISAADIKAVKDPEVIKKGDIVKQL